MNDRAVLREERLMAQRLIDSVVSLLPSPPCATRPRQNMSRRASLRPPVGSPASKAAG